MRDRTLARSINKSNVFEAILQDDARTASEQMDIFINSMTSWMLSGNFKGGISPIPLLHGLKFELSRFYGPAISELEQSIHPIRISIAHLPISGIYILSKEPVFLLSYTLDGGGVVYLNGRKHRLTKGEGMLIDCRQYHEYLADVKTGWKCAFVRLGGRIVPDMFDMLKQSDRLKYSMSQYSHFGQLLDKLLEDAQHIRPGMEMLHCNYLLAILSDLITNNEIERKKVENIPQSIASIREFLLREYAQPISLDSLAYRFHMSKFHLSHEFKKYIQTSPIEYLIKIRIEVAKELLVSTSMNVSEIGNRVGVSSLSHFLYLFQTREQKTPTEFRNAWGMMKKEAED